jgi:hypothetical protein
MAEEKHCQGQIENLPEIPMRKASEAQESQTIDNAQSVVYTDLTSRTW